MLNIKNFEDIKDEGLRTLLADLRPIHISRFPIDVVTNQDGDALKFMDCRFPVDHWRTKDGEKPTAVAFMDVEQNDDGVKEYTIYSRLIQNNRYATYNDEYHTRKTTDLKKMFKYMKEYIKPLSSLEIAVKSLGKANENYSGWVNEPAHKYNTVLRNFGNSDLIEVFSKLKAQGVAPVNDKVVAVYEEAIPAYEEYDQRRKKTFAKVHVFINPDSTVQVTEFNEQATQNYDSLESVPEGIRQQVAMLQISEIGSHVGCVGTKVSEREFWLDTL